MIRIKMKSVIKHIQTGVSKGFITNVIIGSVFGGGVIKVTSVMICGSDRKTASVLSFVIEIAAKPKSASFKKYNNNLSQEKLVFISIILLKQFFL